ncbi:hypothetical protein ACO1O0_001766 [Amphichorda felina]
MAFIRQYKPSDFDATAQICRETLAPSLVGSEPAWRMGPYLWTHQYTHLSPTTSFVLDDGTGRAVGYCIGCPDIPAFAAGYGRYVDEVLERPGCELARPADVSSAREPWALEDGSVNATCLAQLAWNPRWLLLDGNEDVIERGRYRATMHIDLLEGWQGRGWGRKLIERFVEAVRAERQPDTRGIWIGVAADNGKVVPFYEKMGFRVREGGDGGSIVMVRDLD